MGSKVSPKKLYNVISSHDILRSFDLIRTFKVEVKSGIVNVDLAQQYMKSLIIAYKEPKLSISSFSTICHLIKLIRMKKPTLLSSLHSTLIPFLLQRLKEPRTSLRSAAMKALVTIWEVAPLEFERDLKTIGLKSKDPLIRQRLLEMIEEISKNSPDFTLDSFISSIVACLVDTNTSVVEAAYSLLVSYLNSLPLSKTKALSTEFVGLLKANHVGHSLSIRLLSQLKDGRSVISLYKRQMFSPSSNFSASKKQSFGSTDPSISRPTSASSKINYKSVSFPPSNRSFDKFQNREKIIQLLASFPEFLSISKIPLMDINDDLQLLDIAEKVKPCFEGKETEKNWTLRITSIRKLQSLIRGNAIVKYRQQMAKMMHDLSGCIAAASQSLRTTLSSSGCQLCKELAFALGPKLDSYTIDSLTTPLLKLTCSRKTITHRKANLAMMSFVLFTNSSSRMITQIHSSFLDKNVQARAYALIWTELFLLRHSTNSNIMGSSLGYIDSIIGKAVSDSSSIVREIARPAFWTLNELFPKDGEKILLSLSHSTLSALEKSRYASGRVIPTALSGGSLSHSRETSDSQSSSKILGFSDHGSSSSSSSISEVQASERKPLVTTVLAVGTSPKNNSTNNSRSKDTRNGDLTINDKGSAQEPQKKEVMKASTTLQRRSSAMKSPITNKPTQLGEYTEKINRENEIYNGLLSQDPADQKNSFDELIKMRDKHLPAKFGSAFNVLSIRNPGIMLYTFGDERSFKYLINYLSTNNIIRIFCFYVISQNFTVDTKAFALMIHLISIDDLCLGLNGLITACNDSSKIQDLALSFQFVKHRDELLRASFKFVDFVFSSEDIHLESYLLSSLFDSLLQSWEFATHLSVYITLLKKCASKDATLFKKSVSTLPDEQLRSDIVHKLALKDESDPDSSDVNLDYLPTGEELEDAEEPNLDGLTMVVRKGTSNKLAPVETDMTMIMPKFKNRSPSDLSAIKEEKKEKNSEVNDENNNESNSTNPFVDDNEIGCDNNKQAGLHEMKIDDVFSTFSSTSDLEDKNNSGSELHEESMDMDVDVDSNVNEAESSVRAPTTGINRLSINDSKEDDESSSEKETPVQNTDILTAEVSEHKELTPTNADTLKNESSVPNTIDPLAALTKSSDRIAIYEDQAGFSESSKEIVNLNTWQDLTSYELRHASVTNARTRDDLLTKLKAKIISYDELISLMYQLEDGRLKPEVLADQLLEFLTPEIPIKQIFVAMHLIRMCLSRLDKKKDEPILSKLLELCFLLKDEEDDELYFAIKETMEVLNDLECLVLLLQKKGFKKLSLKQKEISLHTILLWLMPTNITYEDVFMLDSWLFKLLEDEHTVLRKLAVAIYAKLYRFMTDQVKSEEGDELIDKSLFQKMDESQIELIKYYAAKV